MQSFDTIHEAALDRAGSSEQLTAILPTPRTVEELKQLSDAFCLSNMTRRIFQAGLNRKVIDNKWPAFKEVFQQFDIDANRILSDEALELLMSDKRIVRHWRKIQSVRHNAQVIDDINHEQGSFVDYLAEWPSSNIVGFWDVLKKRFKQLGGASGPYFLRRVRKDTFLLTRDVVRALMYWGAIDVTPKNKTQLKHVQQCMNEWHAESHLSYSQISMILARSVD